MLDVIYGRCALRRFSRGRQRVCAPTNACCHPVVSVAPYGPDHQQPLIHKVMTCCLTISASDS
jgi:hypothetical protein